MQKTNAVIKIITRWFAMMSPQFQVLVLSLMDKHSISPIFLDTPPLWSLSYESVSP